MINHYPRTNLLLGICVSFLFLLPSRSFAQTKVETLPKSEWLPQISQNADSVMPFDPLFDNDTVEPSAYVGGSDDYSERVDSLMTVIYNAILRIYNDDTVFISKFVLAQRIWMKYRDAELEAIMPAAPKGN